MWVLRINISNSSTSLLVPELGWDQVYKLFVVLVYMAAMEKGYTPFKSYVLEPGTKIYKGDNQKFFEHFVPHGKVTLTRGPAFFAITPKVAETYGVVFEFVLKERLFILDLDHSETVDNLYRGAPENIQRILTQNYGYTTKKRVSEHEADRIFSQYLCGIGLNGYVLQSAKTFAEGTFHPEIMLCDMTKLDFNKIIDEPSKNEIKALQEKMLRDKLDKEQAEKRREIKMSRSLGPRIFSPRTSPTKTVKKHHSPTKTSLAKIMFSTP